jgi:hypothetical protein
MSELGAYERAANWQLSEPMQVPNIFLRSRCPNALAFTLPIEEQATVILHLILWFRQFQSFSRQR